MSHSPTPSDILEAPELAVLHALDETLAVTQRALLAAHPDLEDQGLTDGPPALEATGWIADAILTNITALATTIARYRGERARLRAGGDLNW